MDANFLNTFAECLKGRADISPEVYNQWADIFGNWVAWNNYNLIFHDTNEGEELSEERIKAKENLRLFQLRLLPHYNPIEVDRVYTREELESDLIPLKSIMEEADVFLERLQG